MSTKQAKGVHVNGTTTPQKKGCSCGGEGTTIQQLSTVFPQLKSPPRQMTLVGFFFISKKCRKRHTDHDNFCVRIMESPNRSRGARITV